MFSLHRKNKQEEKLFKSEKLIKRKQFTEKSQKNKNNSMVENFKIRLMNFSREVTPELQQGLYIFSNENWSCATNKPNQACI